jgi:hypothetical protein
MTLKSNANELALIAEEIGAEVIRETVLHWTVIKLRQYTIGGET